MAHSRQFKCNSPGHATVFRSPSTAIRAPIVVALASLPDVNTFAHDMIHEEPNTSFQYTKPLQTLRSVDYSAFVALVVFQGMQGTTGYEVTVQDIRLDASTLTVYADFKTPGKDWFFGSVVEGQMSTDPYQIVRIPHDVLRGEHITINLMVDNKIITQREQSIATLNIRCNAI